MAGKLIRASEPTWRKLREVAYRKEMHIKDVLDDIVNGKLNPLEIEAK
jgi:hypothetical protein